MLVLCKRDNRRIIGKECHNCAQRGYTGEIKQWFHQRTQDFFEQAYDSELYKDFTNSTCNDTYSHKVEHCIQQQIVRIVHNGVEHIGCAHTRCKVTENEEEYRQANNTGRYASKDLL